MALTKIKCIHCESEEVVKNGKRATGIQSLKCKNCGRCFQESYLNNGAKPETNEKEQNHFLDFNNYHRLMGRRNAAGILDYES